MRVNLKQIKDYSQCSKYGQFKQTLQSVPRSEDLLIAENVIRKSYNRITETQFRPDWRTIVGWVDGQAFKNVDVNDTDSWNAGKGLSERILNFLKGWYNNILLNDNVLAYPGLTLERPLENHHIVWAQIPVIKASEIPTIISIDSVVQQSWQLYNDIEVRGKIWLVSKSLQCDEVAYQYLTMGPRGGFSEQTIYVDSKGNKKVEDMMSALTNIMDHNMAWPSVTEKCHTCPFKRRCVI